MNLSDLILSLSERLLTAWQERNQEDLDVLMTTFGVLREQLYQSENSDMIQIANELEEATRNAIMGFKSTSQVPTKEAIRKAFSEKPNI